MFMPATIHHFLPSGNQTGYWSFPVRARNYYPNHNRATKCCPVLLMASHWHAQVR